MEDQPKLTGFAALPFEVYERIFNYVREDLLLPRDGSNASDAVQVDNVVFLRSKRLVSRQHRLIAL